MRVCQKKNLNYWLNVDRRRRVYFEANGEGEPMNDVDLPELAKRIKAYVDAVLNAQFGESAYYTRECPATERIRDETAEALISAEAEFVKPLTKPGGKK